MRASARGSARSTRHSASERGDPGFVAETGWLVSLVSGMSAVGEGNPAIVEGFAPERCTGRENMIFRPCNPARTQGNCRGPHRSPQFHDRPMREQALVLFSGGQDSTTCLAWALANFGRVETVGFRYGQRHAVELDCRPVVIAELRKRFPAWARKLGDDHMLDLDFIRSLGATAMTEDIAIRMTESGLPNTFVPGRTLPFFTAAAALPYRPEGPGLLGGIYRPG